jgi:hypothetical protein
MNGETLGSRHGASDDRYLDVLQLQEAVLRLPRLVHEGEHAAGELRMLAVEQPVRGE